MTDRLVVIPCYNEAQNLTRLLPKLESVKPSAEIVFVNDGSTDNTREILEKEGHAVLTHEKNRGYSAAIRTGLSHALEKNYRYVCFMDSDGQHDPKYVPEAFAEAANVQPDLLIGSRFVQNTRYQGAASRRLGMIFFRWLVKTLTGKTVHDTTSGFKVFNRRAMNLALSEPCLKDFHAELIVYLLKEGCSVAEIPITVGQRQSGQSMYSWKDCVVYPFKTTRAVFGILSKKKASSPR